MIPEIRPVNPGSQAAALGAAGASIVPLNPEPEVVEGQQQEIPEAEAAAEAVEEVVEEQLTPEGLQGLTEDMTRAEAAERLGVEESQVSDSVYTRMKSFAGAANAARAEAEAIRRERDTLMQMVQQATQGQQQQTPAADLPKGEWFKPEIELGEDATEEDQLVAAVAERLAPLINQGHAKAGSELVNTIAPYLKDSLNTKVEREWGDVEPVLKTMGVTREEVEPLVTELQGREPGRPLRSMVFDVASGILERVPQNLPKVPATAKPGAGRKVPAQAKVETPSEAPTFESLLQEAQSGKKSKGARESLIGAAMKQNMVRQHSRPG